MYYPPAKNKAELIALARSAGHTFDADKARLVRKTPLILSTLTQTSVAQCCMQLSFLP